MARALSSSLLAGAIAWLLVGCAGGDTGGAPPSATAVAGAALGTPTAKPIGDPSSGTSAGAVAASGANVPSVAGKGRYGVPTGAELGVGASLAGGLPFPIDDAWNRDLVRSQPDPGSASLVAAIGPNANLAPGFGTLAGVPYAVVGRTQATVTVRLAGGAVRSWPIPADLPSSADASARLAVVDRDAGLLYELTGATRAADGSWDAARGAAWRLDAADAAPVDAAGAAAADGGLPVFPGLVRFDEAASGAVRHALRVTVPAVGGAFLPPARSVAAGAAGGALPPLGLRLRLKGEVPIPADASPAARAILQALKTYGMIVVGTGPALTIEGVPDARWDPARLAADLARLRGTDFEAIAMDGLVIASN
jgi:hypothetical protein